LPAANVRTGQAVLRQASATEEVVGTVRARTRASISPRISARIEALPVQLGQKLKAGDLIAKLDAGDIDARLQSAKATLDQSERDWKRAGSLFQQQASTRAELEAAESRYQVAKAAMAEAEINLGFATVKAPFDGVVTRKHVEAGDLAQPGRPLIDLEDPSRLEIEAEIPEAIVGGARVGSELAVRIGDTAKTISGVVRELAPTADPVSRTFQAKIDLAAGTDLMPGRFARVLLPTKEGESLRVPAAAIVRRGQLEIAFVVQNDKAHLHLVKTGRATGEDVEILAGLRPGDVVVTEGGVQLVDGQPVAATR